MHKFLNLRNFVLFLQPKSTLEKELCPITALSSSLVFPEEVWAAHGEVKER